MYRCQYCHAYYRLRWARRRHETSHMLKDYRYNLVCELTSMHNTPLEGSERFRKVHQDYVRVGMIQEELRSRFELAELYRGCDLNHICVYK